jgi:threonine dehydratase
VNPGEPLPLPTFDDVLQAAERIRPWAHRTPVLTCAGLDRLAGARLYFKCENLQKVGAFKFRGATNAVFALDDSAARRGVATHSSGNHAAALALAARNRGIGRRVSAAAPAVKKAAVSGTAPRSRSCEPTLAARRTLAGGRAHRRAVVHLQRPAAVISGQGTAALELLEEVGDLDVVMTPVGGGGLASGTALTVAVRAPSARVIAAEPAAADDAYRSLREGRIVPSGDPQTVCDGLRTSLGELTFAIIRRRVAEILTVGEPEIVAAMRVLWERMKLLVEPSSAVPFAALLAHAGRFAGLRVGIIVSGGNVDLDRLPWQAGGR